MAKKTVSPPLLLYLSVPYGLMLLGGGVVGFVKAGSVASLFAGILAGGFTLFVGYAYYTEWRQSPRVRPVWAFASAGLALIMAGLMGTRYMNSGKFMPSGMVAALSAACTLVYALLGLADARKLKKG